MKADEYCQMDATALAGLVREREVRPDELVEVAIQCIEKHNPVINSVVTRMYEQGMQEASGPLPPGPFAGVPFLLKDLVAACRGVPLTAGSRYLSDYVPDYDSELVVRYRKAGLVIIGKTSCPEFGILPTTEPELFGPCRNPWNTSLSTGGSSGGSAASVAAGMVPMAHANDGGGSIRIPSSCCGVFGFKPTRARNPLGPEYGDQMTGFLMEHAVTRSVRDSAALLDATCGPGIGDPYMAPPPERPYISEAGTDPGSLRIAFATESPTGTGVHPDCVKAVRDVAALCEGLGHRVEEFQLKMEVEAVVKAFMVIYSAYGASCIDSMADITGKQVADEYFEPLTWAQYQLGKELKATDYLDSLTVLQKVSRNIAGALGGFDIFLTPTISEPPYPLGSFDPLPDMPLAGLLRAASVVPFTVLGNFTGMPAMSVPLHWNGDNLPIGTMFYAHFGQEGILFRLASQLEAARPWAHRRPPVQ